MALLERLEQPVAGDHRADRGVARGHALGARDDVRDVAEVVAGEQLADPAERADDLVGDQQHVVLVADLADPLEVPGGRREAAAGVLHRLQEDGRDRVRPLELDGLGDAVGGPAAEGLEVVAQVLRSAVVVGVRHLVRAGHERLERDPGLGDAGDRQRALRGAVVGDAAADHLVLARLADQLPVLLGQLPGRLDGLAAAGREEDPVQVARRGLDQPLGQLDGPGVGVGPEREEGQVLGLLGRGLGQLDPAVADLHDEQPGQPVEVAPPLVVVDVGALTAHDDRHAHRRSRTSSGG